MLQLESLFNCQYQGEPCRSDFFKYFIFKGFNTALSYQPSVCHLSKLPLLQ